MAKRKTFIKRLRQKIRYKIIYGLLQVMIFISARMSRAGWLKLCGALGRFSSLFTVKSRRRVVKHLTLVYGQEKSPQEIRKLSVKVYEMLGKNAGDIIQSVNIKTQEDYEKFRVINGIEHAEAAYKKGKGVIFLTAHLGPFEYIATELAFRGYKPLIVGTKLKDGRLNELLASQRNKFGATLVERGKDTVKLVKNLKSGGTMIILIDQDTKVKSRFVNFLGFPCATPIGATLMALKTGAAVVPMFLHQREDYKIEINCYPEIEMTFTGDEETDLVMNTQKLSDATERAVRKYPEQW
ncbi:MAG TPA: lysophospholipid acyltransferase family protein, partial [Cyclobacteriaceae bacterium]|nr:lysophospholipid acyltransferase family protein [Cyclobacteriaceae bacterium]